MSKRYKECEVNHHGVNKAIKYNILSVDKMRSIGFTDRREGYWYYCKYLGNEISFNVTIPKKGYGGELIIEVLDENFLQNYDYQAILERTPNFPFALKIEELVEQQMEYLQSVGVLSGHKRGEYI